MLLNDPRQFGYYTVGNTDVYSKIEAIELSRRINQPVTWHFNDEEFGRYDWTTEPECDLRHLYIARAQQIREQYDYVVLFFSSGADSHNMLETFIHGGVEFDEIASFHSYAADKNTQSKMNNEIWNSAIPYVQRMRQQKKIKDTVPHRMIDLSYVIDTFSKDINWLDFPYMFNSVPSINNVARAYLRKCVPEWANLIAQGKRVALVWAHDKPRLMQDDRGYFFYFLDIFDNCVSTYIQQTNPDGWFDELFYSSPKLPALLIKQAHVLKKFLEKCPSTHPYVSKNVTGHANLMKFKNDGSFETYWLTSDGLHSLIYPWCDLSLYIGTKLPDVFHSLKDNWFMKDEFLSKNYKTVINGLFTNFKEDYLTIGKDTRYTKNYMSPKYYLG